MAPKKKRNNAEKNAPSASTPIDDGGATKKKKQEPPPDQAKKTAVSTSSERKSSLDSLRDLSFLFEKKIDGAADLKICSNGLKKAIGNKTLDDMVFTKDPSGTGYVLSFGAREGSRSWENIVAEKGVEEGDTVTAIGSILTGGHIRLQLYVLKKDAELGTAEDWTTEAFLLFERKLERAEFQRRDFSNLAIDGCKDVVEEAIDRKLKEKGLENFLLVAAIDPKGREYKLKLSRGQEAYVVRGDELKKLVSDNGLLTGDKVWCWGRFLPDGSIQMKIDVDKKPGGVIIV